MPPRRLRRLCLPVILALLVVLAAVVALALVATVFATPVSRRPLRTAAFALGYLVVELAGLLAAAVVWGRHRLGGRRSPPAVWAAANQALLAAAVGAALSWAGRCFGYQVTLEGPEPAELTGAGSAPVLVLARHAGPGDSFSLVQLLSGRWGRGVRIVLKDALQVDPLLDVLLNRTGCCFLSGDPDDATRIGALAGALRPGEALLLFPEGGNWTPSRRRRAIRHLRSAGKDSAARAATLMTNVLPPRPAGVMAALDARPDLAVVLIAHAGLDRIVDLRGAWAAIPLHTPMTVRAWAALPPPEGDEQRVAWLTTEWATVDEWVDLRRSADAAKGAPGS